MRILYCYLYGILGGVCTQLLNRSLYLEKNSVDVFYHFTRDSGISHTLGDNPRVLFDADAGTCLDIIRRERIDIAIVIDSPQFFSALTKAKKDSDDFRDLKVVAEVHTTTERGLKYLSDSHLYNPDAYIVPSGYMKLMLSRRFRIGPDSPLDPKPVHVVENCISPELFHPVAGSLVPEKPVLLWVGKIDAHKKWPVFLEIAAACKRFGHDFDIWLLGGETAPHKNMLDMLRSAECLDILQQFRWFPRIEYAAMKSVYSAVAASGGCKVVTSSNESFGMSVLESLLCGCPVVASSVGGIPAIAPRKDYLRLYPFGDIRRACRHVEDILCPENNRRIRRTLQADIPQLAGTYSPDTIGKKYLDVLQGICSGAACDCQGVPAGGRSPRQKPFIVFNRSDDSNEAGHAAPDASHLGLSRPAAASGRPVLFSHYTPLVDKVSTRITVATILDTFSHNCFKYEANLIPMTLLGWKKQIELAKPRFLFVESAWAGNDGKWKGVMTRFADKGKPLLDLLDYCREIGLPTVFWNKEDPPNYDTFMPVARSFDHVFTTDENCIPRYVRDLGHDRVRPLRFAAQPVIHNPFSYCAYDSLNICFAGTWYAKKHLDRQEEMDFLLEPSLERGLHIFDRKFGFPSNEYLFPPQYQPAIQGCLEYEQMLSAYRAYKVFLNVNSVKDSFTMFSRRVFEILACNTPVISTYSSGIRKLFDGLVMLTNSHKDTEKHLDALLHDEEHRKKISHLGYRTTHSEHTYKHRLDEILRHIGLDDSAQQSLPGPMVSVICIVTGPTRLKHCLENYRHQTYGAKELIMLVDRRYKNIADMTEEARLPDVWVIECPSCSAPHTALNIALGKAAGEYWCQMNEYNLYGKHFLSDMMLPFKYIDADIVSKYTHYRYEPRTANLDKVHEGFEHKFVDGVLCDAMVVKKSITDATLHLECAAGCTTPYLLRCADKSLRVYSPDAYNFIRVERDGADSPGAFPQAQNRFGQVMI